MEGANVIRIRLQAARPTRLGVYFGERSQVPRVIITDLSQGGEVEKSGLVHRGDSILRLNGIDVSRFTREHVYAILKELPSDSSITLLLKGPDSCTTYLKTTFTTSGLPVTVRITEPMTGTTTNGGQAEGFLFPLRPLVKGRRCGWVETPTHSPKNVTPYEAEDHPRSFNKASLLTGAYKGHRSIDGEKTVMGELIGKKVVGIEQAGDELSVVLQDRVGGGDSPTVRRLASAPEERALQPNPETQRQRSMSCSRNSFNRSPKDRSPSPNMIRSEPRRNSLLSEKGSPCSSPRRHQKVKFLIDDTVSTDSLHSKSMPEVVLSMYLIRAI